MTARGWTARASRRFRGIACAPDRLQVEWARAITATLASGRVGRNCAVAGRGQSKGWEFRWFTAWHAVCAGHGVASSSESYRPRNPADSVLFQVVRDHFETFRAQAASLRDGEGLPRFVEQEFRDFLRCGCLAGGFARLRCTGCGLDRFLPFSCKAARSVRAVAGAAWRNAPRTWSTVCSPRCPCGSGS